MTKKEMNNLIKTEGLNKEIINGLKKLELAKLESLLFEAQPTEYVDSMIELVAEAMENLKNVKRDEETKAVASEKNTKKKGAPKAPKDTKKEVKEDKAPKEAPKAPKEAPKAPKEAPKAPKDTKKDKAPTEVPKDDKIDFSKFNGYDLERIWKSNFNALSKEDKKIHTAINKEYEQLKKGQKLQISVLDDPHGEYAVANCLVVYRDALSAIAVDIETYSKYEINRIKWAMKRDFKHTITENGNVNTMELVITPIK